MRKVSLEIEATVLIPVKVLLDVETRADEGANMEQAVRRYLRGQPYSKADVENIRVSSIRQVGYVSGNDLEELLETAVEDAIECKDFTLSKTSTWSVIDSR